MGLLIKKLFMSLALWLFELLDTIFDVFKTLAGIDLVNAAGEDVTLAEYFMGQTVLYQVFFSIVICSIAVVAICMVAAIIKSIVNMKGGERKSHAKTVGQGVGSLVITLTLAAVMVAGISASDMLLGALYKSMNVEDKTVGQVIFDASVENVNTPDYLDVQKLKVSYEPNGTRVESGAYLYDYSGIEQVVRIGSGVLGVYMGWKDPDTYTENGLTKFNMPRGKDGKLVWADKYADEHAESYDKDEVWIHVDAKEDDTYWTEVEPKEGMPRTFKRAYLGTDGKYYGLNITKLTPVVTSGWMPGHEAKELDFANETKDTIYGVFDTYALVPCFEDEDDMIRAGKIQVGSFNYLIAFLCGIIVLIALCSTMLGLVKRLYDLVILFLALPLISATIPLDDGAKFKLWRETVISKIVLAYGSVFAVCVFMLMAGQISAITIAGSTFVNNIFRVFLICGGALTISGGQLLFARLIGGSAEESREMAQSARTIAAGAGTVYGGTKAGGRLLFGTKNANGQRVGGAIKGGASLLGSVGGGAVNAVGGALGGQAYRGSKLGRGVSATQKALKGFGGSAGFFGQDKSTGGNTLGGAIGSGVRKLGGKFAGSRAAQRSGLNNGLGGLTVGNAMKASENRRAKARQNARDMMSRSNAAIEKARESADNAQSPFKREVLSGFENNENKK